MHVTAASDVPGRAGVVPVVRVHPDEARFDHGGHAVRPRQILRPDTGAEAVLAAVREVDGFLLGLRGSTLAPFPQGPVDSC